ncbi:MAG TPA: hypothetical protein VJP02_15475 [Candidatus Sulfotelmatobacter sp.]|nr:hypothetical protein [Candidatus Sulfotelmatobacter sp.]
MANHNDTLQQSATNFLGALTDHEREALVAFLNSPTGLLELKTHLPLEFVLLAADALQRAGLD